MALLHSVRRVLAKMATARASFRNDRGVTMIEYGLIAALIAVVAVVAIGGIGTQLKTAFEKIESKLTTANS